MFETAIPGAGYGYGTQQVGSPLGTYGSLVSQFGQPPQFGQPQFGQPQFGQPQFGQPQFGQPQFGQPQFGQPQFGQPQFGQPQFGQPQFGQPQFGPPQFGQSQVWGQQLGITQPRLQVIPVVTSQGWIGLLLLATGQPLLVGATAGGISGGLGQTSGYGYGATQGMIGGGQGQGGPGGQIGGLGGYLPLQFQQQIPQVPQMYGPGVPIAPSFPGQLGGIPIH